MSALPDLDDILLEKRQSTLITTLNRPQAKNALTAGMVDGLLQLCAYLNDTRDIRTLVLRGAGSAFCAGGDIKDFGAQLMAPPPAPGEEDPVAKGNRVFGDLMLALDALPQAFVCVVEGPAFGGAMGFLSVADVVIAGSGAKFSLSETTLGIIPAQIGPFVARKIGLFNARRLTLTGARFDVAEALRVGLVSHFAGPGAIERALAETLSAIGHCEPSANAAAKRLFNDVFGVVDGALLDRAAADFTQCLRGAGKEGAMAFAAKKSPPWVETYTEHQEA